MEIRREIDRAGIREIHFPAEFSPHKGTLMIWPERPGSWGRDPSAAEDAFASIISRLLEVEEVWLLVSKAALPGVRQRFAEEMEDSELYPLTLVEMETDDAWARDTGPTFVTAEVRSGQETGDGKAKRIRLGINWTFNAWGGEVDGLYADWSRDALVARKFTTWMGDTVLDAGDFVLEGGSIHTDGEGTLMVTESCLLSPGRNPGLDKAEIEEKLKSYLGVSKVLWLPRGIYMDETNEHVDNIAAFIRPGEVVLAWTDNREDPQYELSAADLEYLSRETDARGRRIKVHKLPIPDIPVRCSREDIEQYIFEPGEDEREEGERLAASYVNFYFANGILLLPRFGGENAESDRRAVGILSELCPDRRVIPIPARSILLGGGNIHCITQQIPLMEGESPAVHGRRRKIR